MPAAATRTSWKTTQPPKRTTRPVRLRFSGPGVKISQGDFYWSSTEKTWIECAEGKDTLGLYAEDGWKVLGWKEVK